MGANPFLLPRRICFQFNSRRMIGARILCVLFAVIAAAMAEPADADQLLLPKDLSRNRVIDAVYQLDQPYAGRGVLLVEWDDADHRLIERRKLALRFYTSKAATFPLDLRRAVVASNHLHVQLTLDDTTERHNRPRKALDRDLVVPPSARHWSDYQAIMWQSRSLSQDQTLRALGITAGMIYVGGQDDISAGQSEIAPLLANNLRWYVENIATDFYSAYHRWADRKPANWRFARAKALYQQNPNDIAALIRDPSLTDPRWLKKICQRLTGIVRAERPYRPLYYDLGDETGIADLSVAWDFDFSQSSLAGFRRYLKSQYRTLDALKREWGSNFSAWDQIVPLTTRQAMQKADGNFSAWADFKAWMDTAFAQALKHGTNSIHRADYKALAGIEGAQASGWGGYDYSRLARAVDVVEIYDDVENMAALRSFNPAGVLLNTYTIGAPDQEHSLWQELVRGARGAVLWDPNSKLVHEDGSGSDLGKPLAPVLSKLEGGLGALLIASKPNFDPVAILYSPASMRTSWLLDWQPKGDAWSNRDVNSDYDDPNAVRMVMRNDVLALWHVGLAPRFVTDEAIARGELISARIRVLVLPRAIALSAAASSQIRAFVQSGGVLVAQGQPSQYDQHSRRLARPYLAGLFEGSRAPKGRKGKAILLPGSTSAESVARIAKDLVPWWFDISSRRLQNDVEIHSWNNGEIKLLSLQRDLPSGDNSNQNRTLLTGKSIDLELRRASYVYDLGSGKRFGRVRRVPLELGVTEPTLLALSPWPLLMPHIAIRRLPGHTVSVQVGTRERPSSVDVIHLDVLRPDGQVVRDYSGNLVTRKTAGSWRIPLALNEQKGKWRVREVDSLTGQTAIAAFDVR